jgi:hypothetical protein
MVGPAIPDDPASWRAAGEAMQSAAELLWARIDVAFSGNTWDDIRVVTNWGGPALLLSGYAVENLLKGLRVKQIVEKGHTPLISSKAPVAVRVWGHNLPELAMSVGLDVKSYDSELLNTLWRNILWAGRYPTAGDGPGNQFIPRIGSNDSNQVRNLVDRLKALY